MTSRERVRKILNFEEADRPAIDLGATRMTGTSAWTYVALKRALGIEGGETRVYDLFQMLAEVEEEVLDALGCDFAMVPDEQMPYGLERNGWKEYTFWDGQTFQVPADFQPQVTGEGDLLVELASGSTDPEAKTADFDGDGTVGFDDFFLFADAFGQSATGDLARFDLSGDTQIGFDDFFLFADAFGRPVTP